MAKYNQPMRSKQVSLIFAINTPPYHLHPYHFQFKSRRSKKSSSLSHIPPLTQAQEEERRERERFQPREKKRERKKERIKTQRLVQVYLHKLSSKQTKKIESSFQSESEISF